MRLAPYIDQSVFHDILLGKISHVYEIDSSHIIAESEQIDGQSDIRTIAGIVDDPKYFRFADSTFSGRSVQFRHFIRLERVVVRLGNLFFNSDIIYNPQRAKTSAYRILGKSLSSQSRFITLQPCRINIGEIDSSGR